MSLNRKSNQVFRAATEEAALDAWVAKQDAVMDGVAERANARAKRTPEEQLLILENRPGRSLRERTRLNRALAAQTRQRRGAVA
jgi:hypothetical protein